MPHLNRRCCLSCLPCLQMCIIPLTRVSSSKAVSKSIIVLFHHNHNSYIILGPTTFSHHLVPAYYHVITSAKTAPTNSNTQMPFRTESEAPLLVSNTMIPYAG